PKPPIESFIGWLFELTFSAEGRQTISRLRHLSADPDLVVLELLPRLAEFDDPTPPKLLAGFFGLYVGGQNVSPDSDPRHNFGWSARKLRQELSETGDPFGVEKHFRSMLDSDIDQAAINLQWFIRMF